VIVLKLCHTFLSRLLVVLVIISFLVIPSAYCLESEDSQIFITGFNAYQQKDYVTSIDKMNEVLEKFPGTPLRDVALFWLSRAHYKAGNLQEAARTFSRFSREYPDNPLVGTVEDELVALTARYENGEKLPANVGEKPVESGVIARKAKIEEDRVAVARAEEAKLASLTAAEEAHVTAVRQAEEKTAREQKERELERERISAVTAEQNLIAEETVKLENAELQRITAIKAEEAKISAQKAEQERLARAIDEQARNEAGKVEAAKQAALEAETSRLVTLKAEAERKTEESRADRQKSVDENARVVKAAFREKAINQYKAIIDKYPSSKAAATAAAKLRELGIVIALPVQADVAPLPENAQVLRLEVAQFAGFEFSLSPQSAAYNVAQPVSIPFEVINRGNGTDAFQLASAFPAEFRVRFTASPGSNDSISLTPDLRPGEVFRGVINLVIPAASIDGMRISHPVKVTSRLLAEASQSREVKLLASAPLLRAVVRTEKTSPLPGEKILYRVAVLNVGSAAAQDVTFRLNFPPQLKPVDFTAAGFRHDGKSALTMDGLQVSSGQNREFTVTFQLLEDSLAGQELTTRAELINVPFKTNLVFVSNTSYVEPRRSVALRGGAERLTAIPGQVIAVPFIISNSGNIREKFRIDTVVTGGQNPAVFNDLNRDGIRQTNEPVITEIGPLAPGEEAGIVVEVVSPKTAADGSQGTLQVTAVSEGNTSRTASGSTVLNYSRPVLKMVMAGRDGHLKPGDVASFDLTISNSGSNLARVVELQSAWPEQLEMIAAEPATSTARGGDIIWRFKEVGAGEQRSIKVSFRVKPGTGVGTAIQVKNILTYEDQLGSRY
jgi:uncharacterized repeat protein (TIGR01451 family)